MRYPTVEDEGDDLYVRNIATSILSKHSQIADNGWTSEFYIVLWANSLLP